MLVVPRAGAPTALQDLITARIAAAGPLTVAEYMELALYHPALGYYATRAQRSGRGGDFYTSVDAGPLFGTCLAAHIASRYFRPPDRRTTSAGSFDLVDAGAGNGRLARDILDTAQREYPEFYRAIRLHLVERSRAALAAQRDTLGAHAGKLASAGALLPPEIRGVVIANELLDALPCHLVEMTADGLRELRVGAGMRLIAGPPSTPAIAAQLSRAGVTLTPGARAEVNLQATRWIGKAARALGAGALLVFDYGFEAADLYAAARTGGTLARYAGHRVDDRWLEHAGDADLTSHVDFTAVRLAAEAAGLRVGPLVDQATFLVESGMVERLATGRRLADVRQRLQARTLIAPGGLGGTMRLLACERHPA